MTEKTTLKSEPPAAKNINKTTRLFLSKRAVLGNGQWLFLKFLFVL